MRVGVFTQLDPEMLRALRNFASCELSVDHLRTVIHDVLGIHLGERWLSLDAVHCEAIIRITPEHIDRALAMRRGNALSEQELVDWATTLLTNSIFFWDGKDAKTVSEWVNGLSLDLVLWSF